MLEGEEKFSRDKGCKTSLLLKMTKFILLKSYPFAVLDCNVHLSEYFKNLKDKVSDTLLLSHLSYRCGVGYIYHALQRS